MSESSTIFVTTFFASWMFSFPGQRPSPFWFFSLLWFYFRAKGFCFPCTWLKLSISGHRRCPHVRNQIWYGPSSSVPLPVLASLLVIEVQSLLSPAEEIRCHLIMFTQMFSDIQNWNYITVKTFVSAVKWHIHFENSLVDLRYQLYLNLLRSSLKAEM